MTEPRPPLPAPPAGLPRAGQWFTHVHGGVYRVTCSARVEASPGDWLVIYADQATCEVWARPLPEFRERFTPLTQVPT